MKVVKVITFLDFGGVEKVFETFARLHEKDRFEVVFVVLGKGGATEKAISGMGYRVLVLNENVRIPNLGLIRKLRALFRAEAADVVHATGAEANFHGTIAAFLAGVPLRMAEEIGMPQHSRRARWIFRVCYGLCRYVIAVSGKVAEYLERTGEVPRRKIRTIFNPVDAAAFSPALNPPGGRPFRILFVGRLDPIKNLDLLIRAMSALQPGEEALLELVGEGPERGRLEELVAEKGLLDRVRFHGYQKEPGRFFAGTSLFVLPSFSEGHSIALIEAMLTGTPCVATRVGGSPEFIRDGVNGWLIDPKDQQAFDGLLKDLMQKDASYLEEVGRKGRQTVMEQFMPETYMRELYKLYESHG